MLFIRGQGPKFTFIFHRSVKVTLTLTVKWDQQMVYMWLHLLLFFWISLLFSFLFCSYFSLFLIFLLFFSYLNVICLSVILQFLGQITLRWYNLVRISHLSAIPTKLHQNCYILSCHLTQMSSPSLTPLTSPPFTIYLILSLITHNHLCFPKSNFSAILVEFDLDLNMSNLNLFFPLELQVCLYMCWRW